MEVAAGTNASQEITGLEVWEQKATQDVISSVHILDRGAERMVEGDVSPRRRFFLLVVAVLSTFIVHIK